MQESQLFAVQKPGTAMGGLNPIFKACDLCRKKKIRCEPSGDSCLRCIKFNTECHFTPIATKRKPRRPAGYRNVLALEERLKNMEGLLKTAIDKGGHFGDQENHQRESSASDDSGSLRNDRFLLEAAETPEVVEVDSPDYTGALISRLTNTRTRNDFTTQNSTVTTGVLANFPNYSLFESKSLSSSPFPRHTFQKLPTKSVAQKLIQMAFASFNCTFPIFDQATFLQSFHERYSDSDPRDPAWWACINVVLSLAHYFRAMFTVDAESKREHAMAYGYLENALSVVSELTMLQDSLPAVQALLGMTIILQGTLNPRSCSVLIAAAMRLAHTMDLHNRNRDSSFSAVEIEQRRRVFWIAYFLDRDISLRLRQPLTQDDDDMDVDLPPSPVSYLPKAGNEVATINFFNSRIGLAIIQGQIYKRLYSVRATQQSDEQRIAAARELNSVLAFWRSSVPIDFGERAVSEIQAPTTIVELVHLVILRFTYVYSLIAIHRVIPPEANETIGPYGESPDWQSYSESLCIIESRESLRLIQITPYGDCSCIWVLLHFLFASVNVILHNILYHPGNFNAHGDLLLVAPFLELIRSLAEIKKTEELQKMFEHCADLYNKAEAAVNSSYMIMA